MWGTETSMPIKCWCSNTAQPLCICTCTPASVQCGSHDVLYSSLVPLQRGKHTLCVNTDTVYPGPQQKLVCVCGGGGGGVGGCLQ